MTEQESIHDGILSSVSIHDDEGDDGCPLGFVTGLQVTFDPSCGSLILKRFLHLETMIASGQAVHEALAELRSAGIFFEPLIDQPKVLSAFPDTHSLLYRWIRAGEVDSSMLDDLDLFDSYCDVFTRIYSKLRTAACELGLEDQKDPTDVDFIASAILSASLQANIDAYTVITDSFARAEKSNFDRLDRLVPGGPSVSPNVDEGSSDAQRNVLAAYKAASASYQKRNRLRSLTTKLQIQGDEPDATLLSGLKQAVERAEGDRRLVHRVYAKYLEHCTGSLPQDYDELKDRLAYAENTR